ncbi:MAG: hypothetical protein GY936_19690 [Ignavibacteriae bacterium]|nr:hypothetical protein [Ignavibacteriota bacterium]
MKILKAYIKGLASALSTLRMSMLIFFFTLLIGLMITIPFKNTLTYMVGHSMLPSLLLNDFDYTSYEDIIRNLGDVLKPFTQIMFWVGLVYLIFSIFFAGGILNIFQNEDNKFSIKSFFEGCGKYFFRFLRLSVIVIILNIIITLIVYIPLGMVISHFAETVESEASLFYIGVGGVVIYLVLLILSLIISDYTKIKLVTGNTTKVFRTFWHSIKFTFRHFFGTYTLYVLLTIVPILFFVIYYFIDSTIGMTSGITIVVMFLIQQLFIWVRVVSKIWFYSSQLLYHNSFIQTKAPEVLPPTSEEWDLNTLKDDTKNGDLIA